jgi:hypothetical protein
MMLCGCHRNVGDATTTFKLFATPPNAEEFHSWFATDPTCHGLTLGESAIIRLHSYGAVDAGRTQFGGYVAQSNGHADLDFAGDTPVRAIRQACAIMKAQGGKFE